MRISDWSSDVCSSDLGATHCDCAESEEARQAPRPRSSPRSRLLSVGVASGGRRRCKFATPRTEARDGAQPKTLGRPSPTKPSSFTTQSLAKRIDKKSDV